MVSLNRGIGFAAASFLVLNGLIGAGIFALPARMADTLGAASPWIFLLFGLLMLSVVWCFGQLAARFSETGGPIVYARAGFGPFTGFQTGWLYYLARATAIAANMHVLLLYAGYLYPPLNAGVGKYLAIMALTLALVTINIVGIRRAVRALDVLTVLKLLPFLLLLGVGFGSLSGDEIVPAAAPSLDVISAGALLTLYAFIGFETVVVTSGETRTPQKTIPRALMVTISAIAVFYFAVQLVYWQVMGARQSDDAPLIALSEVLLGRWGAYIMTLTAVFSVAANLLANVISTSRLTYAMAEEKTLPASLARLHPRFATPHVSIIALGVFAGVLALSGSFVWLAIASVLTRLVVYGVCILSLRRITQRQAATPTSPSVALKVVPWIALLVCVWAAAQSEFSAWGLLLSEIVIGTLIYVIWQRKMAA